MEIKSKEIALVPVSEIKQNPKNRNIHSKSQIKRLEKLIREHGFREPLIVSKRSGLLVAGHGRLEAAKNVGLNTVPVVFQEFDSYEQEYAFGISTNAIQSWSELDFKSMNMDLAELQPFDVELLGLRDFVVEPADKLPKEKQNTCPACGFKYTKSDTEVKTVLKKKGLFRF